MMRIFLIACLLVAPLLSTGCHIRGGEPSQSELFSALEDQLEHANDRGGIKINMGNAGAFRDIQFNLKLHSLTKHACSGANYAYTCKVTLMVSYPPVKETPEMLDADIMVFDGPDGWRVVE